jgi:hypothetical protein
LNRKVSAARLNSFAIGSVLPSPLLLNCFVTLYFLFPLAATIWFYPRRILERTRKRSASAFVLQQLGFTRVASNPAAKLAPQFNAAVWFGLTLTIPLRQILELHSSVQLTENGSELTSPLHCAESWSFLLNSIQLGLTRFYPCPPL